MLFLIFTILLFSDTILIAPKEERSQYNCSHKEGSANWCCTQCFPYSPDSEDLSQSSENLTPEFESQDSAKTFNNKPNIQKNYNRGKNYKKFRRWKQKNCIQDLSLLSETQIEEEDDESPIEENQNTQEQAQIYQQVYLLYPALLITTVLFSTPSPEQSISKESKEQKNYKEVKRLAQNILTIIITLLGNQNNNVINKARLKKQLKISYEELINLIEPPFLSSRHKQKEKENHNFFLEELFVDNFLSIEEKILLIIASRKVKDFLNDFIRSKNANQNLLTLLVKYPDFHCFLRAYNEINQSIKYQNINEYPWILLAIKYHPQIPRENHNNLCPSKKLSDLLEKISEISLH